MLKNRRYLGEYEFKGTVNYDAIPPLVEPMIFEKCQSLLSKNKLQPASFKTFDEKYLLTGKIFCGHCNATMSGVSAVSKSKSIYRYYQCIKSKKKSSSCKKNRVSKGFIEVIVIDKAMQILKSKPLIKRIVDDCYKLQTTKSSKIPALKSQLKQVKKEIDNVMNAIKAGIITKTTKSTLERLESEQETLEIAIAKENIERPLLSKEQIQFWIMKFAKTDIAITEQKQRLIDTFVNSVHVYDDKMVIVFNYKDGERCLDLSEQNNENTRISECSVLSSSTFDLPDP
jgi:hypothetical protein